MHYALQAFASVCLAAAVAFALSPYVNQAVSALHLISGVLK